MATETLAELRDRQEEEIKVPTGDAYIDSAVQLDDVNEAYKETAYAHNWPQLLTRAGIVAVANVGRYTLPTGFRKARYVRNQNKLVEEMDLDMLSVSRRKYSIDRINSEIILKEIPQSASTAYTLSNAETAASAVTIELDTVSGLSQGDEIFIDSAAGTDEYAFVSSVSSSATTITARLRANKSASDILYLVREIIDIQYYRTITLLSATTDTMILPDVCDFIVPHYAAGLYFEREQQYDRAEKQFAIWKSRLDAAFISHDKNSTGQVTQFSIG